MVNHIFIGIDLGDKNSVARIAVNLAKTERFGFVNDRRGRARLFEEVKQRGAKLVDAEIVMAYEASACGFILCDEAEEQGIRCWVLAPTKIEKSIEQRKHKNDERDAEDLVEKLRGHILAGNRLPAIWIPDRQMRDDRELVRARFELVEKQTRLKAQIQMLVKRYGQEKPAGCGAGWSVRYRRWLQALAESEMLKAGARRALGSLLRQLSFIEAEIDGIEKSVLELAAEPRHKPMVSALTAEYGVGVLTAISYRTEIGYAGRFHRGRHVGKFVGLTPTSHESGQQQDRKGHISRQGPPRLRKMLCQASWIHIRGDANAKRFYQQIVSRNPKKKKIAIVAVMRRLAVRLWHRMRQAEIAMANVTVD
jgi:transposase